MKQLELAEDGDVDASVEDGKTLLSPRGELEGPMPYYKTWHGSHWFFMNGRIVVHQRQWKCSLATWTFITALVAGFDYFVFIANLSPTLITCMTVLYINILVWFCFTAFRDPGRCPSITLPTDPPISLVLPRQDWFPRDTTNSSTQTSPPIDSAPFVLSTNLLVEVTAAHATAASTALITSTSHLPTYPTY
ncbi:hypothetical protein AaE_001574 [Aphanomyces astaci]|uniref:Uncharacterized protein n=1 Tax=Aphanomyces astaci TaxID=112090 RepID=A0A6A5AR99_APHAT|nr:hypothetical protein AaE_001574 [Aphanomyces astaci]